MPALTLCTICGEPCHDGRCAEHRPKKDPGKRLTRAQTGYDSKWDRLSKQARRLQPWCSDCGTPDDLTGDHLQWPATSLRHVDVVCRSCNSIRGAIRTRTNGTGQGADVDRAGPRGLAFLSTQSDAESGTIA